MSKESFNGYSGVLFLFVILLIAVIGSLVASNKEGFSSLSGENILSPTPFNGACKDGSKNSLNNNQSDRLLNSYPATNNRNVNNNTYNDIWWYLPIFEVGSYAQVTNNLKHRRNPDDGQCIDANFCGTLYHDDMVQSNIIKPLPPVPKQRGIRVNYYNTPKNILTGAQPGENVQLPAF